MSSVILAGDTSGTITLQAPAVAGTSVLTLPITTDTLIGLATTDTLTNKTLTSPILITPALGTPTSGVMTNVTGTASGLTAGNVTTNANLTGPITSVGNATSLGSFTSAQLLGALTDETGTGSAVFATSPTLVTPALGTPSALVGTNITGTATAFTASNVTTNANLTGAITSVGNATSVAAQTGTGSTFVMQASPTLTTPNIGTPSAGVVTNLTGTASININGTVGATTPAAGAFTTLSASGATTLSTTLVVTGNAAVGTTILTPFSTGRQLQVGAGGVLYGHATDERFAVLSNAYEKVTTGNWTYITTKEAINLAMDNGALSLQTAPSGTADTTVTWTERFAVGNTGAVTIGGTLAAGATTVTGTLSASGTTTLTSASANQLVLTGGTTVETRLKMIRGADDADQFLMAGWGGLVMERTGQAVSAVQPFTITMRGTTDVVPISVNYTGLAVTGTGTFTPSGISSGIKITQYSDSATYGLVTFNGATGSATNAGISGGGGGSNVYVNAPSAGVIYQRINGVDVASVSSTGLAVTGTLSASGATTLATTLVVTAASNSLGVVINGRSSDNVGALYYYANNGSTQHATIIASASELQFSSVPAAAVQTFRTNGSERMRIDSSGNVGIGTSSPSTRLDVVGASAASAAVIKPQGSLPDNNDNAGLYVLHQGTGGAAFRVRTDNAVSASYFAHILVNNASAACTALRVDQYGTSTIADFTKSGTVAMRIDSSGKVGIGTASPASQLQIGTTNAIAGIFEYTFSGNGVCSNNTYASAGGRNDIYFMRAGTNVGRIETSLTATAYYTTSDYRLKDNISPMTEALDKVLQLKPVTYKWKKDDSSGQGFIAHELQSVVPDCVSGEKDATREEEYEVSPAVPAVLDADGKETTPAVQAVKGIRTVPSYQGVDTSFLVATLTAAIQELKAIIDTQATRITALEAK